eukprot:823747-Ditylum_brightwellii.AAC.1
MSLIVLAAGQKGEKGLVVGEDFHAPCNEFVQQQLSCSHEMQKSTELFTGKLKTKRTLISSDTHTKNNHARYCCAQRCLLKFTFSHIRCLLEEVELDIESPMTLPWNFWAEAHSLSVYTKCHTSGCNSTQH